MKKMMKLIVSYGAFFLLVSCPAAIPRSPNDVQYGMDVETSYTENILVTPESAKTGDIVTITGTDFLSPEEMRWEAEHPGTVDYEHHVSLEGNLVLFNVYLEEIYKDDAWTRSFHVRGTKVTEFISFEENKIVCKVPEGAKTGRVAVMGDKNALVVYYDLDDKDEGFDETVVHPSKKEFVVLDTTTDTTK